MTDDQLRQLAHQARASVPVSAAETERALGEVTADTGLTGIHPAASTGTGAGHQRWRWVLAAAASLAIVAGAVVALDGGDRIRTIEPISTGPDTGLEGGPTTVAQPPATSPAPTDSTSVPGTSSAASTDSPAVAGAPAGISTSLQQALAGVAWEGSGISRSCTAEQCTQLAIGPTGAPVTYDPATQTLTRHVRVNGELVTAVLPEPTDWVTLQAVGPDDMVYLHVNRGGVEEPSDLLAVALAPGDAGRIVETGSGDGVFRGGLVPTAGGLVVVDDDVTGPWPSPQAETAMAWVDRDPTDDDSPLPGPDPYPNGVRSVLVDPNAGTVTLGETTWQLPGSATSGLPVGTTRITPTFDAGFVAAYDERTGAEPRQAIVRGYADGTTEEWVVPVASPVIPEPQGTVLVPAGDQFVRVAPFESRPNGWDGRLEVDLQVGTATPVGLSEHLAGLDWGQPQPPWDRGYIAFANAVAGPIDSPDALRTIQVVKSDSDGGRVVVTTEHLLDDSVYGTELRMLIGFDRSVDIFGWGNACQAGRGHQEYRAASCV